MLSTTTSTDQLSNDPTWQPHGHPSDNPWYALIRNAVRAIERGQMDQARRAGIMVMAYAPESGSPTVRAARACARALLDCLETGSAFGPHVTPILAVQAVADALEGR